MNKQFYVYILTNPNNTVLYTGVANNLRKRIYQHKEKIVPGFTSKYNLTKLIYYEIFDNAYSAISREKQIKAGSRKKKVALINKMNSGWRDLYKQLV
ncbi:MAG: excinuclease ABC subunit C [Candidatus Harrisonbacteria bacterium RIFCSPHIGHO2_01_FULL_44_13]|uniref:Excinuclease ABC subunit C n=1 Tax=Candidatus Harrisonbacteria bacterium RIFCSPLOWO2_01_FULL_44_18 TaxID=1798407 RepID=A0A1G1ZM20_9BACT|nr:MAG: excinuclease ABC subunit C [Candidatus Harrisonbacteria bacterium RIFCSPHIGHO2_01_FULL_44_13]OGY65698.1 MAG: excinuclease ABC subunit C [Candidatus Harrisonbacteria bacterium RIFCSPLOWO2_01_FULL_44_18]